VDRQEDTHRSLKTRNLELHIYVYSPRYTEAHSPQYLEVFLHVYRVPSPLRKGERETDKENNHSIKHSYKSTYRHFSKAVYPYHDVKATQNPTLFLSHDYDTSTYAYASYRHTAPDHQIQAPWQSCRLQGPLNLCIQSSSGYRYSKRLSSNIKAKADQEKSRSKYRHLAYTCTQRPYHH
jgi:hypothetical protein